MELIDNWINLSNYDQRKDYNFIKANRELLQNKDITAEEKGLYILLLINAQQINVSKAYANIGIDDLIDMSSDSDDIRTINNQRKIILTILDKLKEKGIISDKIVDNKLITCINTDYIPFTQIYLVAALDVLSKLKVRSIKRALRNIAIYGFIVASAGADNTPHAHIYINGLYYMSQHMSIPYETLRKNIDYLVDRQILARRVRITKDRRKHTLLTTYTKLDIQQLDNYVNSVFGKQQQQEKQRQETPQLVDNDSDNTPAKSDKTTTSYFDEVSDYVGFDVTDDKTILKIVKGWESHYNVQIVLTALDKLKYKIADFRPSSNLHMINWVNKLLTSGGYLDDVKAGLAEVSRVAELRKQGKVVDAKDIPNERIDFLGDEKDADNSSIKVKKDLETKQETEDSDVDDVIEDVDFQAIADNIFKYN